MRKGILSVLFTTVLPVPKRVLGTDMLNIIQRMKQTSTTFEFLFLLAECFAEAREPIILSLPKYSKFLTEYFLLSLSCAVSFFSSLYTSDDGPFNDTNSLL